MTLEQVYQNISNLLNLANQKGAFNLNESNAAIQTLAAFDQVKKEAEEKMKELQEVNYELHKRIAQLEEATRPKVDTICKSFSHE